MKILTKLATTGLLIIATVVSSIVNTSSLASRLGGLAFYDDIADLTRKINLGYSQ
ncbi:MAG: hypothetical protein GXP22_02045 [Gammaproteobacteria bacterium]|nr:hypothetical protein [Gammaproteobacteria bacterium]